MSLAARLDLQRKETAHLRSWNDITPISSRQVGIGILIVIYSGVFLPAAANMVDAEVRDAEATSTEGVDICWVEVSITVPL
jgi:hypothetical protein